MTHRKNLIQTFLFIIVFPIFAFSQTYLSPVLGYDATNYGQHTFIWVSDSEFYKSPAYGLKIEQQLADKLRIGLEGYFSRKFIPFDYSRLYENGGTGPFATSYGRRIDIYNISAVIGYYFNKNFKIGIGPSINFIGNYHSKKREEDAWQRSNPFLSFLSDNFREYGGAIHIAYEYHNFQLGLSYHQYFHNNLNSEYFIKKSYSRTFHLTLGYLIKLKKKRK